MADEKPTTDEKAADTAEAYEQASGQGETPATNSDPVMDAITEAEAAAVEDAPEAEEPGYINKEYEEREQVEYVDTSGDDVDSAEDQPEPKNTKKSTAKKS